MAYRILKKYDNTKWVFDEFTGDKATALNRLRVLAQDTGTANLALVREEPFDETFSSAVPLVAIESVSVHNDGETFRYGVFLEADGATGHYVIVDIDATGKAALIAFLEGLGLTNVSVTPWAGVEADNPTGEPVRGSYLIPEGFFTIYSQTTSETTTNKPYLAVIEG